MKEKERKGKGTERGRKGEEKGGSAPRAHYLQVGLLVFEPGPCLREGIVLVAHALQDVFPQRIHLHIQVLQKLRLRPVNLAVNRRLRNADVADDVAAHTYIDR